MPVTESSGVITVTGTETNLTNFASHVETETIGSGYTVYHLTTERVVIEGTLTIDPDTECLAISAPSATNPSIVVEDGGTLNFGRDVTGNSNTRRSAGVGLLISTDDTVGAAAWNVEQYGGLHVKGGGAFVGRGGVILSSRPIGFFDTSSTIQASVDIIGTRFTKINTTARRELRLNVSNAGGYATGSQFVDMVLDGFQVSHRYLPDTFSLIVSNGQIVQLANSPGVYALSNLDTSANINTDADLGVDNLNTTNGKSYSKYDVTNAAVGSALRLMPKGGVGNNRQVGLMILSKSVLFDIADAAGSAVSSAKVYIRDTDNGYRKNANEHDFSTDRTYTGLTGANGRTDTINVVTAVTNINSTGSFGYADWDTTNHGNRYKVDRRGKSDTPGADLFDVQIASYAHNFSEIPNLALRGLNTLTQTWTLVADTQITESAKATVDTYTTLETAAKIYDACKAHLYDNFAGETAPYVTRTANTIDAGSRDVTLVSSGSDVVTVAADGALTLVVGNTYADNLTTSGTVTIGTGVTVTGGIQDSTGVQVSFGGLPANHSAVVRAWPASQGRTDRSNAISGTVADTTATTVSLTLAANTQYYYVADALRYRRSPVLTINTMSQNNATVSLEQILDAQGNELVPTVLSADETAQAALVDWSAGYITVDADGTHDEISYNALVYAVEQGQSTVAACGSLLNPARIEVGRIVIPATSTQKWRAKATLSDATAVPDLQSTGIFKDGAADQEDYIDFTNGPIKVKTEAPVFATVTGTTQGHFHTYLDAYADKDDFKADVSALATLTQVGGAIFGDDFQGVWAAGTFAVDHVVWHGDQFYRCTVARTSTNTDNPATDTGSWQVTQVATGSGGTSLDQTTFNARMAAVPDATKDTYKGTGTSSYSETNLHAHLDSYANKSTFKADVSTLASLTQVGGAIFGDEFQGVWAAGTFAVDHVVWHGDQFYRCTVARTSANTDNPATDTASWQVTQVATGSGASASAVATAVRDLEVVTGLTLLESLRLIVSIGGGRVADDPQDSTQLIIYSLIGDTEVARIKKFVGEARPAGSTVA